MLISSLAGIRLKIYSKDENSMLNTKRHKYYGVLNFMIKLKVSKLSFKQFRLIPRIRRSLLTKLIHGNFIFTGQNQNLIYF